uniref:NADH dehydrogenase subunit 4L n=1 Tax=Euplotes vannus TaxID=5939 RepID=UPI002E75C507|nr:NADH dehydrogenase subunit 4L [Euplotes vannus]UPM52096.1 NADH dehydrogenase subunit 4L [Euplotes vannus]
MLLVTASLDLNFFYLIVIFLLVLIFLTKSTSLIFLLIVMETSWITLYLSSLVSAFLFDFSLNLSLGFFFLMFSAAEITVGLALFLTTLGIYGTLIHKLRRPIVTKRAAA